jgi:hypothetical protein
VLGWTDKIKERKKHEQQRESAGDKKFFFAESRVPFATSKLEQNRF